MYALQTLCCLTMYFITDVLQLDCVCCSVYGYDERFGDFGCFLSLFVSLLRLGSWTGVFLGMKLVSDCEPNADRERRGKGAGKKEGEGEGGSEENHKRVGWEKETIERGREGQSGQRHTK